MTLQKWGFLGQIRFWGLKKVFLGLKKKQKMDLKKKIGIIWFGYTLLGTPAVTSYKVPLAVLVENSFNKKFASSMVWKVMNEWKHYSSIIIIAHFFPCSPFWENWFLSSSSHKYELIPNGQWHCTIHSPVMSQGLLIVNIYSAFMCM